MAINERLIDTEVAAAGNGGGVGTGNQEEGLTLHLDANDVDSYDGDGSVWYDITNHEYKPAINVSEHFNTVLYNGTGVSNQITDVGFEPDLIWVKRRGTADHYIVDTVRGNGNNTYKNLASNETQAEGTTTSSGITNSTIVDGGFTMQGNGARTNASGSTYVAWCWKAGGAAVSNTDGTTTSQVSANQDLGFSIVKHTGTSSNRSIGHGLGIAPELIITKNTTDVSNWSVSGSVGDLVYGTNKLQLNTTAAANNDYNEVLSANGTTFTVGGSGETNGSGDSIIHYCFASKRGVSKVGSYTGTGASGNKVDTGFEPAFVMIKASNYTENWIIYDNKRSTDDPRNEILLPNSDLAELSSTNYNIDFDRDGFTINSTQNFVNRNGINYIYYAVAKNTNETSLIPDTNLELHLDAASFPQKGESGYSNTPSTWADSSGNSNNGTISGATFDSELGNYLDFDGSNDMVTTSYDIPSVGAKTIEFWFNDNGSSGTNSTYPSPVGGSNAAIWTGGDLTGSYSDESLGFYNADTLLHFYIRTGTNTYRDNKWHHVAITDNGSNQHAVYVDGESHSISYLNGSSSSRISMNNVQIGKGKSTPTTGTYSYYFNGQVGQVRIYSSALTETQVRQNYNFTKPNYPNGFDGTITGADWNSAGHFVFNGSSDYVKLPFNRTLNEFSFHAWVRPDSTTGDYHAILGKWWDGSNRSFMLTALNQTLKVDVAYTDSNTDHILGTKSLPDSTWSFVCVTWRNYDGLTLTVNNSTETFGINKAIRSNTNNWYIGNQDSRLIKMWDGAIAKCKMYDKKLSSTEITAIFDSTKSDYGY